MAAVIEHPGTAGTPVTNSAFLRELALGAAADTSLWVTAFGGSPDVTDTKNWFGRPYGDSSAAQVDGWGDRNTYFSVAALRATADGEIRRRKANFSRLLALVVDDVHVEDVPGPVSYVLATSPGKVQVGIFIDGDDPDAADIRLVDRLVTTMADRGMMRADISGNNAVRYVRLPVGQNQKPRELGHWQHQLHQWSPRIRLSLDDAAAALGIDLDELRSDPAREAPQQSSGPQDERLRVLTSNIMRGEGLHDAVNQIAASMVASGAAGGAVVNVLRGLMDASLAPKDDRWLARYNDIPRAVSTAQEKFKRPEILFTPAVAPDGLVLTLDQLDARAQAVRWQVKGAVPARSLGVMFGASGTFKSFIAIDLGLHLAHGLPWLGRKSRPAAVLYVAAEGGAGVMQRIKAWHLEHSLDWQAAQFFVCPFPVLVGREQHVQALVEAIRAMQIKPDLVIVDTMSQTFDGNENSAEEVSAFFRTINTDLMTPLDAGALVVHHSGHEQTSRPRGSSAITANVDYMFGVFRDEAQMLATVECVKQKDGDRPDPMNFSLSAHETGRDEDGDAISSLAARHVNQAVQLLEAVEKTRDSANSVLLRLVREYGDMQMVRREFMNWLGDKKQATKRSDWKRALDFALANRLVETDAGGALRIPSEGVA